MATGKRNFAQSMLANQEKPAAPLETQQGPAMKESAMKHLARTGHALTTDVIGAVTKVATGRFREEGHAVPQSLRRKAGVQKKQE